MYCQRKEIIIKINLLSLPTQLPTNASSGISVIGSDAGKTLLEVCFDHV